MLHQITPFSALNSCKIMSPQQLIARTDRLTIRAVFPSFKPELGLVRIGRQILGAMASDVRTLTCDIEIVYLLRCIIVSDALLCDRSSTSTLCEDLRLEVNCEVEIRAMLHANDLGDVAALRSCYLSLVFSCFVKEMPAKSLLCQLWMRKF